MRERIAFIKTGWSKFYDGSDLVKGWHSYLNEKQGYEAYNFLPGMDGKFYGYLPPIGKKGLPNPRVKKDWLLIFVARQDGVGSLKVVGWYDSADFLPEYQSRSINNSIRKNQNLSDGEQFLYCIVARSGHLIPEEEREGIDLPNMKRTPLLYVRGRGKDPALNDEKLAILAEKIVQNHSKAIEDREEKIKDLFSPDPKRRKETEKAAIENTKLYLERLGFHKIEDKQRENCGYDLLAFNEETKETLRVEVKGTYYRDKRFFLTRNEWRFYDNWRLSLVTEAVLNPTIHFLTRSQVEQQFHLDPLVYESIEKGF
jgi:hypothetical protein